MENEERLSGALQRVYYLFDAANTLLYIGRSPKPKWRRWVFEHRTGIPVTLGLCQRHSTFEAAQQAERETIRRHAPPYNKKVVSARGMTGKQHSDHARAQIGAAHRGKTLSDETKRKMSESARGRPSTFKGKHHSAEAKAKLSRAQTAYQQRRREEQHGK